MDLVDVVALPQRSTTHKHTGVGIDATNSVGVGVPLVWSMAKATTVSLFWFAANSIVPDAARAKPRGIRPPVAICPPGDRRPVSGLHLEGDDTIVTTVRTVHIPPAWVNMYVSTGTTGIIPWRQRRDRLNEVEQTPVAIVAQDRHR